VDLERAEIRVVQRADCFNILGLPKSDAGQRTIPIPPLVVTTLSEWKHRCPKGEHNLVFPNRRGNIQAGGNIVKRGFKPALIAAGIVREKVLTDKQHKAVLDESGKPIVIAASKYAGLHSLRHFFASWCINRIKDGGLELPPKTVQARMGHANVSMTMDTYGHLFPSNDDASALAAAETALLTSPDEPLV
jgi:integrase